MTDKRTKISPFFKQCFVTTAVCCSVISSCGCMFGFPGILLPQLQQPGSGISISDEQASWIASVEMLPMYGGICAVPAVMARAGRRAAHFVVITLSLLSWITIILANSYEVLIVGRVLQGAASGMMMPLRSVLASESASPRYRGAFLTTISLAQGFGILLVRLFGSLVSYQMTALVGMSFSAVSLLMTLFTPESPSWLATRGQYDKCKENFMWLRNRDELPELEKMIHASKCLSESHKNQNILEELFLILKRKELYIPIIIMYAVLSVANFTNAALLLVYPIPIINALMGDTTNAPAWMVAMDIQGLVVGFAAVFVIHKINRRTLLFSTGIIGAASQIAIAAYEFVKSKGWLPFQSKWIPGSLISVQLLCVNIGMLPLGSVLAGEVFPLQCRSYAESMSLLAMFITLFLSLKTFPDLSAALGLHGVLALYAGLMAGCLGVAWALLPETRGRTLQEIEEHFRGTPLLDPEADLKEAEPLKELDEIKASDHK